MSGELHQISVAIGELKAEVASAQRSREMARQEMAAMAVRQEEMAAQLAGMAASLDSVVKVKADVDALKQWKAKTAGIVVGVSAAASLVGYGVSVAKAGIVKAFGG